MKGRVAVIQRSLTVGERIELRRKHLGMSRRVVAQLAGRSEEWLRQLEGGKKLDSIEMLYRLAEVLRIDNPMELTSPPTAGQPGALDTELELNPLIRAIMDHPSTHASSPRATATAPTSDEVRALVDDCWAIWLNSRERYSELAARLPGALVAARSMTTGDTGNAAPTADVARILIEAYHLARMLLTQIGGHQLAWLVADRPVGLLLKGAEPSAIAQSSWHVACALLSLGYHAEARDYALAACRAMSTSKTADPLTIRLRGALQLIAAESAAAYGDLPTATELLARARRNPDPGGPDIACAKVRFGSVEIAISAMNIALRTGRISDATRYAADFDPPPDGIIDTCVRYHLTAAYAYSLQGEDFAAIIALRRAYEACPEDIRYDWSAHRTLQKLTRRNHHLIRRDLTTLLELAGLG